MGKATLFHKAPVAARISLSDDGRTAKADAITKKFRTAIDKLYIHAQKLDEIHSTAKEGQARGSGVSLVGGKQLKREHINRFYSFKGLDTPNTAASFLHAFI